jgi:CRISPR-associated protein Cas8b1/Cst1 subtype I-B
MEVGLQGNETIELEGTAALLETLLDRPVTGDHLMPWCSHCSDLYLSGVTMFNDAVKNESNAVNFFNSDDSFVVLVSKYNSIINEEGGKVGWLPFFEMLLASDLCIDSLNESEKIELMALALKRLDYEKVFVNETCHIMISIMKSCNYAPFIEDIVPKLQETTWGYTFNVNDDVYCGMVNYHANILIKYANQFLSEQIITS